AIAAPRTGGWASEAAPNLRPAMVCPEALDVLTAGLLRDVPSYANRVARRALGTTPEDTGFGTVILAGQAELEPLPVETLSTATVPAEATEQVFFTTLERRYLDNRAITLEQYHWLFLVRDAGAWRLTLMFSRTAADDSATRPPTPPQESSNSIIGQAIRLWLRDCRAGALYPIEPIPAEIGR
ncbi:MAG: hypothetical protein AAF609_15155, partial [Cyanobacteria bacterium P01_C01_bin.120]